MMRTEVSRRRAWLMAARPQTLPAGAAPVIVGVAVALWLDLAAVGPAVAALVGALLIQIGTNFANDYHDGVRGVDAAREDGYTRVTQSGLIPAHRVKTAALATYGLALLVGGYLVYVGGVPILVIGLASLISGYAYAGGPYPLGSHGLGDLFVFVFFGVIAVTGTVYVQAVASLGVLTPVGIPAGTVPLEALIASLPMAALSTNVLVVNNVRDLESDRAAGKHTLAVLVGYRLSRIEFLLMMVVSYLVPVVFWLGVGVEPAGIGALLPLVTLPYGLMITNTVWTHTGGDALNPALEQTGKLLLAYAVTFAVGLLM